MRSRLAVRDTLKNHTIVSTMAAQSRTMTRTPPNGERRPKKAIDHSTLSMSCTRKIASAGSTPLLASPLRQTKNADSPISRYKVVHAGANSQFGGVNDGFCTPAYHVGIALAVNIPPTTPASSHATIDMTNLRMSLGFISLTPATRALTS